MALELQVELPARELKTYLEVSDVTITFGRLVDTLSIIVLPDSK